MTTSQDLVQTGLSVTQAEAVEAALAGNASASDLVRQGFSVNQANAILADPRSAGELVKHGLWAAAAQTIESASSSGSGGSSGGSSGGGTPISFYWDGMMTMGQLVQFNPYGLRLEITIGSVDNDLSQVLTQGKVVSGSTFAMWVMGTLITVTANATAYYDSNASGGSGAWIVPINAVNPSYMPGPVSNMTVNIPG